MRARILLVTGAALVALLLVELLFDRGVIFALLVAAAAILAAPSLLADVLAMVMLIAGFFTAGREWRTTTIALYLIFALFAAIAGILRRRPALLTSAVIAAMIAALVFLRR